jgi:hypothetical protein
MLLKAEEREKARLMFLLRCVGRPLRSIELKRPSVDSVGLVEIDP